MKKVLIFIYFALVFSGTFLAEAPISNRKSQSLFAVIVKGNRRAVKKMLSKETDLNILNAEGKTVLDVAVEHKFFKIARDLIGFGAKVTTELNAQVLRKKLKLRARNFFISGFFVTPILWIGTYMSINKASEVTVLSK